MGIIVTHIGQSTHRQPSGGRTWDTSLQQFPHFFLSSTSIAVNFQCLCYCSKIDLGEENLYLIIPEIMRITDAGHFPTEDLNLLAICFVFHTGLYSKEDLYLLGSLGQAT